MLGGLFFKMRCRVLPYEAEPGRTAGVIPQPDPAKGILLFTDGTGIQAYK